MLPKNKRIRLEQIKLLLKAHPEGLRRSEIAKRIYVHRSTIGRYIMELSEETMLWENNFKIGINERVANPQPGLNLPEELSIILSIATASIRIVYANFHLISGTRKMALAMAQKHPATAAIMLKIAEKIDKLPKETHIELATNIEYLAEAMEKSQPIDFHLLNSPHKSRILPEDLNIAQSGPFGESLRVSGKCYKTGKNCSFLLHNIEIFEKNLPNEQLKECPFDSLDSRNYYRLKIKIFSPSIMDNLSSITDINFIFEKLDDGNFMVELIVSRNKNIQNELIKFGSDIEVIYPDYIRDSMRNQPVLNEEMEIDLSKDNPGDLELIRKQKSLISNQIHEIHHRIKNQLLSLISLIDLYSNNVNNDSTTSILDDLKAKIISISAVHSILSKGNIWTTFPVKDYLPELISNLISSMEVNRKIDLINEIDEIQLSEDQLTNIGLIVTELCINSLKHAFKDRDSGRISIKMSKSGKLINLHYKDNGKGFGNNPGEELKGGTGLNLIEAFTEQLQGSIRYFSKDGANVIISFS